MRTNKLLIFFLFALVLVSLVSADKVVTTTTTGGLEINTWEPHTIQQGTSYSFLWDVSQEGMLMKANLTNCTLFLNQNGVVTKYYKDVGVITSDGNAWYRTVTGGNFSELGHYNFQIDCYLLSNTTISGNALASFDVTPNGNKLTTAEAITINWQVLVLILTVIVFMTMAIIFRIDSVKIFFFVLAGLTLFLLIGISMLMTENYLYSYLQYVNSLSSFYIITAIVGGVAIIGLVIWFIYTILSQFSKTKIGNLDNEDID